MRVLIIDQDEKFASMLRNCLEPEGWEVAFASGIPQVASHIRSHAPDVILADVRLQHGTGFDALAEATKTNGGTPFPAVVMSNVYRQGDELVQAGMTEHQCKVFLKKPFSLFDLPKVLNKAVGGRPAPSPKPVAPQVKASHVPLSTEPIDLENILTISRLWVDKGSGTLLVEHSPSGNNGYATVSLGGPLDSAGGRILAAALHGGRITFTAGAPSGEGDHEQLGAQLYDVLCRHATSDFLDDKGPWIALKTSRYSNVARSLPLSPDVRLFLGLLHERRPVGEVLEDLELEPKKIAAEIQCLCRLHLVEFERRADDPFGDDEPTEARRQALRSKLRKKKHRKRRPASMDAAMAAPAPMPRDTPAKVEARLHREVPALRTAAPPIVLGLPATAGLDLAKKAQKRLIARYEPYTTDPELSEDAHELAGEMLGLIDEAVRKFQKRLDLWRDPDMKRTEPELFKLVQHGRDLVFQERWLEAEQVLEQAQDIKLDEATVLGLLGWVRFHHPEYEPEDRDQEALDLLLLSEQFDMNNPTAQYYLARYYFEKGDFSEAAPRVVRAAKGLPKNPHIGQLMAQVKQGWNAPDVDIDDDNN